NVDGTENKHGTIHHYANAKITLNGQTKMQCFFIINVGDDQALLGYMFLQAFNPKIDWVAKTLDRQ
ncbi:hypothetical protein BJV74DRAFT_734164, partial [Russula compacta]